MTTNQRVGFTQANQILRQLQPRLRVARVANVPNLVGIDRVFAAVPSCRTLRDADIRLQDVVAWGDTIQEQEVVLSAGGTI